VWAITSYFNPVRYKRRLSNYRIFRANLEVPLVAVELSFDGYFELTDDDAEILIQLSGGAVLWQKERLLNLAIKAVPPDVKRIAWFDCDVILKRADWVDEAKRQLNEFSVIQLFSDAVHINSEDYEKQSDHYNGHLSVPSIASLSDARELLSQLFSMERQELDHIRFVLKREEICKTGFAWAANRRLLEDHGFYDAGIVGGGDSFMVVAMYGRFDALMKKFLLNATRQQHYLRWAIPFHKTVAESIGHVSGTIYHLKHGKIKNRRYSNRQEGLAGFDFDPEIDLRIGPNGAWQWARPRPELESFLTSYFINRTEDE
jgi:hypothetical protein